MRVFQRNGLACLQQESSRPKTLHAQFDQQKCEASRALLHQSPRTIGTKSRIWTLRWAAQVCQETGLTSHQVSIATIRLALGRLGVSWKLTKHWITSPDPDDAMRKNGVTP